MFEKEKEYEYIQYLEKSIIIAYIIIIIATTIIALLIIKNIIGLLIGLTIGYILAKSRTIKTKIKIQEMKWKIDIHSKIMYKEKEIV